jgi:hypothetical protein
MAVKLGLCLKCDLKLAGPCTFVCPCPYNNRVTLLDETFLNTFPPRNSCTRCTVTEKGEGNRVSVLNDPIGVKSIKPMKGMGRFARAESWEE